MRFQTMSDSM